jgi:hypothetical protein
MEGLLEGGPRNVYACGVAGKLVADVSDRIFYFAPPYTQATPSSALPVSSEVINEISCSTFLTIIVVSCSTKATTPSRTYN